MIRVMIVDDEILVRVGIKSILHWEEHGYCVVCEAGSCREAIEKIPLHCPQIILTDLMMEGMDGFDLIEYCVREHPHIRLVVLSSYNDFEYVRRAMKLGASDYIFKLTVHSEQLLEVLEELRGELDAGDTGPNSIIRKNLGAIKTRLITAGIQQTYAAAEEYLAEFEALALATDFTQPFAVLYLSIDGYEGEMRRDFTQMQLLKSGMENIIHEVFGGSCRAETYNYTAGDLLVVLHPEEGGLSSVVGADFVTIVEYMRRYLGISVSGALSDVFTGLPFLPAAVAQAQGALAGRFFSQPGRLYLPGAGAAAIPAAEPVLPGGQDFADALAAANFPVAQAQLTELFDTLAVCTHLPADMVRMRLLEAYGALLRHAQGSGVALEELVDTSGFTLYDAILRYEYLSSIRMSFLQLLARYGELCGEVVRGREEILQMRRHVRDNLTGDLSVEAAAALVNMSKSYFSHLFKKETGLSYVDYVNRTRVVQAAGMLQNSTMRIGKVAQAVGIQNPNYFSILFKKLTGKSPGEYREAPYALDFEDLE